jgi:phage terminase small subunit
MPLTPKKKRFCEEYCVDSNGTQAAIRAGYSVRSAGQMAEQLLKKHEIQECIATLRKESTARVNVTIDRVVEEYAAIAFANTMKAVEVKAGKLLVKDPTTLPEQLQRAIASISPVQTKDGVFFKLTFFDKVRALDSLGKYLGMFSEFNGAIATLKTYGIHLRQTDEGWVVSDKE